MEKEDITVLAIGAGLLGVILFTLRKQMPIGPTLSQPEKTEDTVKMIWDTSIFPKSGEIYFVHPDEVQNAVMLPVRYPPRPGHELTSLIEEGYTSLFRPRSELASWMANPPTLAGG